ncbi:hypothetical protein B9Z19DRAFT_974255 [Tuber borchii]|uniref:Uncharacterized protein n=1 Tax=Tuber borchii TaxID=42251 RepID=A0A2T6ZYS7_TUBBO|nr:hypothetical protein B9Z19DRAFT_974255 [Tuber borchii]
MPTPPSLQKQNTGRKRVTAKQPIAPARPTKAKKPVSRKAKNEGTTKNIKPVLQRKKPEPLPISDDIWELPLSSPVSQGIKAGGKVQKHSAGINQKAKHVPKPADIAEGGLAAKGKVVAGNRGRRKGRSYKSEARVVNSSAEESTPHLGSETVGPGAAHAPGEMGTGKPAPTPEPKALTKTIQTTQAPGVQPSLRRSLRERKPPKAVIIPSSSGESEGEELSEHAPGRAPARLLSPRKSQKSATTNKRALPEAYKTNAPIKKRKEAPIPEGVGARKGVRIVQLEDRQKGAGEPSVVGGETSAVAPEHVRSHRTTAMSSKRKAHKPTVTPKELVQGSHKRQRTSPPRTIGYDKRGEARAPTFSVSGSPEVVTPLPRMDGSFEARDSIGEGPDLDGWGAGSRDTLPPLNKKEYMDHKGGREGPTSDISSPTRPPGPSAHSPQTAQRALGGLDDPSKGASAHGRGSQKHRHSSPERFPKELLPPETVNNLARRPLSVDILGAPSPPGASTAPHGLRENPQRNAPTTSADIPKALKSHPILNLVDASTSTSDLNEDRIMSTSRSRTSSPPPLQITGERVSTMPKQMPGVTSPMMQLKDKVTCDRAVSADAVPMTAINEPQLPSAIEFPKANSPTGLIIHNPTYEEELSIPNDLAKFTTTQRLKNLVILSEGDEDIVVWDTKEKKGGLTPQRTETGHIEVVDENGSPSRPDAPKPPTRPKKISWEIPNKPKDTVLEPSQESETEENMFVKNSPSVLGGKRAPLGGPLSAEQAHNLARTRPKDGRPEPPRTSTGDGGSREYFKHKDRTNGNIDGSENQSTDQPEPLEKHREMARDVISISSTSPSPTLPLSLLPKEPHKIHQEPEPWEDSDDVEFMEPAIAKVLQILAKRGVSIPKSSPPVLHHSKPKVQLTRNGKRKLGDNNDFVQNVRAEVTNTEDGPFEDVALTKKRHSETHFSKMPQKQRSVKIQRPPCRGNPPDQRSTEEQFRRTSRVVPVKGEYIRRQEWIEDSDHDELDGDTEAGDSMGAYADGNGPDTDTDTYSDSESSESGGSEDEGEDGEEGDEDAHIIWRKSLPKHLKETLSALEQITRGLVKYLVCSEEFAIEMIEEFEAQGKNLIQALDDSHKQEYDEFLENLEEAKKAVAEKAEELDRVIRNGLDGVERKEEEWKNSQMAKKKQHQKLDNAIEKMLMDTNN